LHSARLLVAIHPVRGARPNSSEPEGDFLRIRFIAPGVFAGVLFTLLPAGAMAQQPAPAGAQQPTPAEQQAAQAPSQPAPQPKITGIPDYPEPRTLTIGVIYWRTIPGNGVSLLTGKQAFDDETLTHLGGDHATPGMYISVPITRTGEIKFEGWISKGDGNQTATTTLDLFGQTFNPGDYLATQYQIKAGKLYLDDLLWPYKFPVSKFRLKSLWEVQWISVSATIDAPFSGLVSSTATEETAVGSRQVVLPTFGIAAEYNVTPRLLLRADASGFGLPHRSDIWDANAKAAYRLKHWEIEAGFKAVHFKTSPQNTEYMTDTLLGAFAQIDYHF
jgi:hypothetical protein